MKKNKTKDAESAKVNLKLQNNTQGIVSSHLRALRLSPGAEEMQWGSLGCRKNPGRCSHFTTLSPRRQTEQGHSFTLNNV